MTHITLYQNNEHVYRFRVDGHVGFAEQGNDIVCAAISVLTINTLNAIERFTQESVRQICIDQKRGLMDVEFPSRKAEVYAPEAELLIKSMILGLMTIQEMYGEKYIHIQIQ